MTQGRGRWCALSHCVLRPWVHSEFGFQEGLLALATQSRGNICLDPFPWREASGPASNFSI